MLQITHQQQTFFTSVAAATAVAVVAAAAALFVRYIMLALGSSQEWLTSMAKFSNSICHFNNV